ncbi:MAG TPA: hypothetical protein VF906_05665 [Candidatus Bathyarchaeia archaeon]
MSTASATPAAGVADGQKCAYCAGAGRWSKDVIAGKPPESVRCPHCHGSGASGSEAAGKAE